MSSAWAEFLEQLSQLLGKHSNMASSGYDLSLNFHIDPSKKWEQPHPTIPSIILAILVTLPYLMFLAIIFTLGKKTAARRLQKRPQSKQNTLTTLHQNKVSCSICGDSFSPNKCFSRSNCGHFVHLACGKMWQYVNLRCVLCKSPNPWKFKEPMEGQYPGFLFRCNRFIRTSGSHDCLKDHPTI